MKLYQICIIGLVILNDFANSNTIFSRDDSILKCYVCESGLDSDCESNPSTKTLQACGETQNACVSKFINGETSRSCGIENNCNGKEFCQVCKTEGCNTINMKKLKEDNDLVGMWQDLPLKCLKCQGEDCKGELVTCPNNMDKCVTIFDEKSKKLIERDCSTETNIEKCQRNPDFCFQCKSNGCNNAKAYEDFIDCFSCTSQNQQDCVSLNSTNTFIKKCHGVCMTALYPLKDNSESFNLVRTCLNDKEPKDQMACFLHQDKNCKACEGTKCNNITFPEDRIKCYHCADFESCKKPESKICQSYTTGGSCFAIYDSQKVKSMGCSSEFKKEDLRKLFFENKAFTCQGSDCNSLQNLPKPNQCAVCNSKTDVNCATVPKNVTSATTCDKIPNAFCYSRVSPDGDTERGCWTSLKLEEREKCRTGRSGINCGICRGDQCNKQVFPEERLQCHTCSSLEDPNCEHNPSNLRACLKYAARGEACVTTYNNGITLRGCKKEVECDEADGLSCRSCTKSGCNVVNLKQKQFVNATALGIWQDLPLSCFVCIGEQCKNESISQEKCASNTDSCVTILNNDESGKVLIKGCYSSISKNVYTEMYCKKYPELCISCASNSCNVGNEKSKYVDCLYCGLPNTTSCVEIANTMTYPRRKCLGECMTALYKDSEDQSEPSYNLIRTCADDKEQKEKSECVNGDDENCTSCSDDNCNSKMFPEDRRKCYQCSGVEPCKTPEVKLCDLYRKNDECYYLIQNEILHMGCRSVFSDKIVEDLVDLNIIAMCNGDECNSLDNKPKDQECVACDSNENADCAVNPESIKEKIKCAAPNNKCFSKIDKDGNTIRGCHNALGKEKKECKDDTTEGCKSCNEANCNTKIFPENRRKCFICNSESDAECETGPQNGKICPTYKSDETCVTRYDKGKTERGCGQQLQCDSDDLKVCERCTEDNCNTVDIKKRNNSSLLVSNIFIIMFAYMISVFY